MTENTINQRRRDFWAAKSTELDRLAISSRAKGWGHERYATQREEAAVKCSLIAYLYDEDRRDQAKLLEAELRSQAGPDVRHIIDPV